MNMNINIGDAREIKKKIGKKGFCRHLGVTLYCITITVNERKPTLILYIICEEIIQTSNFKLQTSSSKLKS